MDMLEDIKLLGSDGQYHHVNKYLEKAKIIIYFFSASWVPTPDLIEKMKVLYEENLRRNIGMEIIYVSSDTEERHFLKHFSEQGPWTAIPFKHTASDQLRFRYDITCLPQLIVVNIDGSIISRKGKLELEQIGINVIVTWTEYVQQ